MPRQRSVGEIRLNNITTCLTTAAKTMETLAYSLETPFMKPISNTIQSLLPLVETMRHNRNDCMELLEQTHMLLYPIITLHLQSDIDKALSPVMLNHLRKFTETLYKIRTFVEAQQEKSRIKRFFRQSELNMLLKDCHTGLQQAATILKVQDAGNLFNDVASAKEYAEQRHHDFMELIQNRSDTCSDRGSSINKVFFSTQNSSTSISLLPSEPKIFHGRDTEILAILQLFRQDTTRIAILGAGGMGKTTLARSILHHLEITTRYGEHRIFVTCESASSRAELAALIGSHIGLEWGKDLAKPIMQYFCATPPCLLILDNLETVWEPVRAREQTEEFLSLLTDIPQLALIITMRGAERPAKVKWSRPFLGALKPLTHEAAHQTFIEIADDGHDRADIAKILLLTDNLPLAIDLVAHLVDSEGCPTVLSRWERERTSLISDGLDKRSNLDLLISLSLSSPRITDLPHAGDLLGLLSILPDGLSDQELLQSNLPMADILGCKTALVRTALAYRDDQKRLRLLVPIREHMRNFNPPKPHLVQCLLCYFQQILELYDNYVGSVSVAEIVGQISSNHANIQSVLLCSLHEGNPSLVDVIKSILVFNHCSEVAGLGFIPLRRLP